MYRADRWSSCAPNSCSTPRKRQQSRIDIQPKKCFGRQGWLQFVCQSLKNPLVGIRNPSTPSCVYTRQRVGGRRAAIRLFEHLPCPQGSEVQAARRAMHLGCLLCRGRDVRPLAIVHTTAIARITVSSQGMQLSNVFRRKALCANTLNSLHDL